MKNLTLEHLREGWRHHQFLFRYEHARLARVPGMVAVTFLFTESAFWFRLALCKMFGHRWVDENADAENGTSDMTCTRCGYGFQVRW